LIILKFSNPENPENPENPDQVLGLLELSVNIYFTLFPVPLILIS